MDARTDPSTEIASKKRLVVCISIAAGNTLFIARSNKYLRFSVNANG